MSWAATPDHEATVFDVEVDTDPVPTGANVGRTVAYDDLPAVDRRALDGLLPSDASTADSAVDGDGSDGDAAGSSRGGFDRGAGVRYTAAEAATSRLVPDPSFNAVVVDGRRYPVRVGDGRTVTVNEYRYDATEVAADEAAFVAHVREAYEFALAGLPSEERAVVEAAVEDGSYYAESADDPAFASVARRFHAHEGFDVSDTGGEWPVRYAGERYWASLHHAGDVVDGAGSTGT